MYNRESVMANQGRRTINAMRAITAQDYFNERNIVNQEPDRNLEPDDLPALAGPLPSVDEGITGNPQMIHFGKDQGRGTFNSGRGTFNSGSRGTAQRNFNERNQGRGTAFTQGPDNGNLLDGIDEEDGDGYMQESGMMDEYRKRIRELEIEVQRLNGQVAELNGQLDGYQIERDKMITDYEEYIDGLQEELEQYKSIEGVVKKLQGEKEFLEEEIEKVRKIKAMLENQLNNFNETSALKEMKNKMDILKEQNERLKRLNRAAGDATEVSQLKNELKTMAQQLNFLEKERNLLQSDKDNLEVELRKMKNKNMNQAGSGNQGGGGNQDALREKERMFNMEKGQLREQVEKWKNLCDQLERDKEEMMVKMGSGGGKGGLLGSINFESNIIEDKPSRMQASKAGGLAPIQENSEELKKAKDEIERLKSSNQNKSSDNENLKGEIWNLKKKLEKGEMEFKDKIRGLEEDIKDKDDEIDRLKGQVRENDKKLRENQRQLNKKPEKVFDSGIQEELDEVKTENKKLGKKIKRLEKDKKDLEKQVSAIQDSFAGGVMSSGLDDSDSGMKHKLREAEEKIDLLKRENKKFADKCQEYKNKVKKLKSERKGGSGEDNIFNGSFSIEQKKKKPFSGLGKDSTIEEEDGPKNQGKSGSKPASPNEIKEKNKVIEDLKIKIFLLAAENDRLRGEDQLLQNIKIMKNNPLVSNLKKQLNDPVLRQSPMRMSHPSKRIIISPSGFDNPISPERIVTTTIIRSPGSNKSQSMPPVVTQVFSRSPSKNSRVSNSPTSVQKPHQYVSVKNSRVSNYPSFGGSPAQKLFTNYQPRESHHQSQQQPQQPPVNKFANHQPQYPMHQMNQQPNMMKSQPWNDHMMGQVSQPNPTRTPYGDKTNDLVSEINEVVNRYSSNKKQKPSVAYSQPPMQPQSRSPSPMNYQQPNPLKLEYSSPQSPQSFGMNMPPMSITSNQPPMMQRPEMTLNNPLKKSYDKQPYSNRNPQGLKFAIPNRSVHQNPILSKPTGFADSNNPHFVKPYNPNLSPTRKMNVDYESPKKFKKGFKEPPQNGVRDFSRFTYNENKKPLVDISAPSGVSGQPIFNKYPTLTKRKAKKGLSKLSSKLPPLSPKVPHPNQNSHRKKRHGNEDVGYVLNNVYQPENYPYNGTQPANSEYTDQGELLLPQPKKISSLKNSNLSYGTTPLSNAGGAHPYGENGMGHGDLDFAGKVAPSFGH